jgi:hypothetical protein
MEMPVGLRTAIYQHALGENIYLHHDLDHTLGFHKMILGSGQDNSPENNNDFRQAGTRTYLPNLKVLAPSKQTRSEVLMAGWQCTWKHFTAPFYLLNALDLTSLPPNYKWVC